MKRPHSGRQGWTHAEEHGELSEGRRGAGDEGAGSDIAGDGEEDHVVAGSGDHRDPRRATAALALAGAHTAALIWALFSNTEDSGQQAQKKKKKGFFGRIFGAIKGDDPQNGNNGGSSNGQTPPQ